MCLKYLNLLPNDKIVDWSNLKAFADDKVYVTEKLKFFMGRVENILGRGEKYWLPVFSIFPKKFSKVSFFSVVKSWDCVVKH